MKEHEERRSPAGGNGTAGAEPAGWDALARQIEADERLRAELAASGVDLAQPAVQLVAHLQALRDRLQALRATAAAAARVGGRAAAAPGGQPR